MYVLYSIIVVSYNMYLIRTYKLKHKNKLKIFWYLYYKSHIIRHIITRYKIKCKKIDKKKKKILMFKNNLNPLNCITGDNHIDLKISIVVG